jgi:nitroimidazol reductase NimA-like FMN-containing flavoprotein (pyridoxamine 5'-phosphate oxidase superfamily)
MPERARHDSATIRQILDEALICHVGFVRDDRPVVLPTIHTRVGDAVYLHMSSGASLALQAASRSVPVCVTATLVDGLVLAKSWMHHSMNYRSVVVHGDAELVRDEVERDAALRAVVEHVVPGRADRSRPPTRKELAATSVLRVPLEVASAKVRTGPPGDDDADLELPHWAGVVEVRARYGPAIGDAQPPEHIVDLITSGRGKEQEQS